MAGQAHHFLNYAPAMDPPQDLPYAKDRYRGEVARLYGVLDRRLADREYVAGDYSIADMAIWPWANGWKNQQQDIAPLPAHGGLARAGRGAPGGAGRRRRRDRPDLGPDAGTARRSGSSSARPLTGAGVPRGRRAC